MKDLFGSISRSLSFAMGLLMLAIMAAGIMLSILTVSRTVVSRFSAPPTATPFDVEAMQAQVKRADVLRKRASAEGKNYNIRVRGIETLGTDLRPQYNLVLPDTVYLSGIEEIRQCTGGDSSCGQRVHPVYSFRSIETDVLYSVDSALNEYFSNMDTDDLSPLEKDEARQYFPGLLAQIRAGLQSDSVWTGRYLLVTDKAPALRADQKYLLEVWEKKGGFRAIFVAADGFGDVLATIDGNWLVNTVPPDTDAVRQSTDATAEAQRAEKRLEMESNRIARHTKAAQAATKEALHTPTPIRTPTPLPPGYPPPKATMTPYSYMAQSDYTTILDLAPEVRRADKAMLEFYHSSKGELTAIILEPEMITDVANDVGVYALFSIIPPDAIFSDENLTDEWLSGFPKPQARSIPLPTHRWPDPPEFTVEMVDDMLMHGLLSDPLFDIIGPETRGAQIERFKPAIVILPDDVQAEGVILKGGCGRSMCNKLRYPILRLSKIGTDAVALIDGEAVLHDEEGLFGDVIIKAR